MCQTYLKGARSASENGIINFLVAGWIYRENKFANKKKEEKIEHLLPSHKISYIHNEL